MGVYSAIVLAHPDLRAYYRLGESSGTTANDASSNALHGTYTGTVTLGQAGALVQEDPDTAVLFDGSTGYLNRDDHDALDLTQDGAGMSIEVWFKRAATGGNQVMVQKGQTDGQAYGLRFNVSNQIILYQVGTGGFIVRSGGLTDTLSWHHVIATKVGSTSKLYLDGADVGVAGTNQTIAAATSPLTIGASSGADPFNGSLDEVSLYGNVLTLQEARERYAARRRNARPTLIRPQAINRAAVI